MANASAELGTSLRKAFLDIDWKATGTGIVDGLIYGLKAGAGALVGAVKGLGESVKSTFKEVLQIHSPSKVFESYGKNTTEGYAQGIEQGSGGAQGAVDAMVAPPAGGGSRGAGAPITVNVTINASGGEAKQVAAQLSSATLLDDITKAVLDALHGAGVPVPV